MTGEGVNVGAAESGLLWDAKVQLRRGDGLVARFGRAVLLVRPGAPREQPFVDDLLSVTRTVGQLPDGPPGRALARRLAGLLALSEPADVPAFCVLAEAGDGVAVILQGALDLEVSGPRTLERMTGRGLATWLDRTVTADFDQIAVVPSGTPDADPDPYSDLGRGVVRADGIVVTRRAAEISASPTPWTAPTPSQEDNPRPLQSPPGLPADGERTDAGWTNRAGSPRPESHSADQEAISLPDAAPGTDRPPSAVPPAGEPAVAGVVCPAGHENGPDERYCTVCGTPMSDADPDRQPAESPGWLVSDDGARFRLDSNYVIGRFPQQDAEVLAGRVRPLMLEDPGQVVSRVHARVFVEGGRVTVVDARSGNGTYVVAADTEKWTRLADGERRVVDSGARLLIGDHTLRVELQSPS